MGARGRPGPEQVAAPDRREKGDEAKRADLLLVERGYFESRAKAQAAIEAGLVTAGGERVARPSALLHPGAAIKAEAPHPYVSRGGVKLAHALDAYGFNPHGRVCLDVGASTGGFTDVLLKRGAARVYAVDVGRAQLHPSLVADQRIVSLEATDIRRLERAQLAEQASLVTVDVSFISLRLILPDLNRFLTADAQLIALIKPQFEVGRAGIGRGGIVRDESLKQDAVNAVTAVAADEGWTVLGTVASPIVGGDGNEEYLLGARRG